MNYRITVHSVGCFPLDHLRANAAYAVEHGVPEIRFNAFRGRSLAVVGGGPSAANALDELRSWPGDIWAINGTCSWLARKGIKATLFSVDPDPCLADLLFGVESVVLSSICDPCVFEALKGRAHYFHPDIIDPAHGFLGGSTSATRAPAPAFYLGYESISYFGCEGNFADATHTFKDEAPERQVLIEAGGERYRTTLQFMNQTQSLAAIIEAFPGVLHDRSGGLLSAMLAHPDTWEVIGLSAKLKAEMDPEDTLRPVE